jgi:nitrogen regulatory protein P-II 1
MKLVKAIVRPSKLEEIKDALTRLNLAGMTITEVRGHGRQKGHAAIYRGKEYNVTLLPKVKIEIVLPDELVEETIKTIIETARTGEIGDGRVFVLPVEAGYNIRTGEKDVI